ncbi:MAG: TetR/AcrR family transcriptional regulator [Desulfuromonadales bacterium]|jgi:AcrR family transcriptional regulator|nr:TetR/AcrR family transcriptional regulator [Desulfuromonadales bacterium]
MSDDKASRKQIILKEAARLFREKGYIASNLRELAKRAGIQGGSIYHHFGSKQEILFQLMDNTMTDMVTSLSSELAGTDDLEEKLRRLLRFHIGYTICGPDETYITDDELRNLNEDNYLQIIAKRDAYQKMFEEVFRAGSQQQGWMVADPKLMARAAIQMGTGVASWYKPDGPMSIDQISADYAELLCKGLLPRKAG